jgi:ElaB/YqjD/DUF883 family membrane-anchored ribosome-binding protein
MKNDMKTNVNKAVDTASEYANEAADKATDVTNQAVDKLSEKGKQAKKFEKRLRNEYSEYIRDNPLTSVGIAMGVGFLLSKLMSNR